METTKKEERHLRLAVDNSPNAGPWLRDLKKGQWFLSKKLEDDSIELWKVVFHYQRDTLLLNALQEKRFIVDSTEFSKRNTMRELLGVELD